MCNSLTIKCCKNYSIFNPLARETHYDVVEDLNMLNIIISLCMPYRGDIYTIFFSNPEANAFKLLESFSTLLVVEVMDHEQMTVMNLS